MAKKKEDAPAVQQAGDMIFVTPEQLPPIDLSNGVSQDLMNNGGTGPQGHRGAPASQTADKGKSKKKRKKKVKRKY